MKDGTLRHVGFLAFCCIYGVILNAQVNVTTYHNDNSRTGQNTDETILTPNNVNSSQFGKRFSVGVDGFVYAEPLYLSNVTISGGTHNVLYVATEHDSLYAVDADDGTIYWQISLIPSGGSTVSSSTDLNCGDIVPEVGITGTPVIDTSTGTIYVVAKSKVNSDFFQYLHAIDIGTSAEKFGGPVAIQASVPGTATDGNGTTVSFNSLLQNQRAGLLLENGHVVIAWGAHCDTNPWHGWLMSYSASTLTQEAAFNTSTAGSGGGIWMGGGGPAADSNGNVFVPTGNGTWNGTTDYGDSIVKLGPPSGGTFPVLDYFTPFDQNSLYVNGLDVASGGPVLLPALPSGQQLLAEMGKIGTIYLVDINNMGGYCVTGNPPCTGGNDPNIVQEIALASSGVWGTPAYWNGAVYWGPGAESGQSDFLKAFSFNANNSGVLSTSPTSESSVSFNFSAPSPSISANGNSSGILWGLDNSAYASTCSGGSNCQALYAFDATNLANMLYNSNQAANNRDVPGGAVKFTTPTIANGKVYVGSQNSVSAYGELPPAITSATTASGTVGGAFSYQITATNSPTSYNATGLPSGLTVNTNSGLISGTSSAAGTSTVTLSATNAGGTGTATLTVTINLAAPAITSGTTASGTVGTAFSYQTTASNSPTSFGATGLPAGLSVNTSSGLISGTPTASGTSTLTLSASNSGGTGNATLTLTISPRTSVTFVQVAAGASTGSARSLSVSFSQNTSPGDVVLVAFDYKNSTPSSVTDSQGNTFTEVGTQLTSPGQTRSRVYYAHNIKGGADKVAVQLSVNSPSINLLLIEYAGVNQGSPVDIQVGRSGSKGAVSSGNGRTTTAQDVIFGYCAADSSCTPGSGFATRSSFNGSLLEDTQAGSAGNYAATGSANSGWTMQMIALKPAASVGKPVITSATTAGGTVGSAFSYQITASNSPTIYGATGLPAGLTVSSTTGLISGTPTAAGTSTVTLSATNAGGTGTSTLTLTINNGAPVISSSTTASGTVGTAFSYQITASNSPTIYGATGLPAGLTVNSTTGLISGTPTAAGTSTVTLNATNAGGTGNATLTLTINPAVFTNCPEPTSVGPYTFCNEGYTEVSSGTTASASLSPYPGNGVEIVAQYCGNASCNAAPTQTATIGDNVNSPETCFTLSPHSPYSLADTSVPNYETVYVWYCPSIPSGVNTFTVTTDSAVYNLQLDVVEWQSGSIASSNYFESVDQIANSNGVAGTTATVSTDAPTVNANDLITAVIANCGATIPATPGTGYTGIIVNPSGTAGHVTEAISVTSIGTQTATTTWSSGSASSICNLGAGGSNDTWFGVIVPLVGSNQPPAITSATTASGAVGSAFSYQVAATNSPTSYGATELPAGLMVDTTGLISGTPTTAGISTVTLSATNNNGTGTATLTLTIGPPAPSITSTTTANGTAGNGFAYQITASNSPTSYGASGLPAGLSVNTSSGLISGTPTATGSSSVTLSATNADGTGTATLTLTISNAAPSITSATTAIGTVGSAFSYQISATNSPTSYGAAGLPASLTVDTTAGVISGTPTAPGGSIVTLSATNAGGTGSATLTLTINPALPVISSATTASGIVGTAFSYQITASNSPTSYGATGLPAGLSVNTSSGLISGTSTGTGTSSVTLSASNSGGTGTATLTLTINIASIPMANARTDDCVLATDFINGSSGATCGTSLALQFRLRPGDPIPFSNLAPMNTSGLDADFGTYMVLASDATLENNTFDFVNGSAGVGDVFSIGNNLVLLRDSGGKSQISYLNTSAFFAHTCSPTNKCLLPTGITTSNSSTGDNTHLASNADQTFSRVTPNKLIEWLPTATVVQTRIITDPAGISIANCAAKGNCIAPITQLVNFVTAGCLPSNWTGTQWMGTFSAANDDSIAVVTGGGPDWVAATSYTVGSIIYPQTNNAKSGSHALYGFYATTAGSSGSTEPQWSSYGTAGTTVTDGTVTWTSLGSIYGQGPGFDILMYSPTYGCSHINARTGVITNGTGDPQPSGLWQTDNSSVCSVFGQTAPCALPDLQTVHDGQQLFNPDFVRFVPTHGEQACTGDPVIPNGQCSCLFSGSNRQYCDVYYFQKSTGMVRPATDLSSEGHSTPGYTYDWRAKQGTAHLYSNPSAGGIPGHANPGTNLLLSKQNWPADQHGFSENEIVGDPYPLGVSTQAVPSLGRAPNSQDPTGAGIGHGMQWYGELDAAKSDGSGTVYRLGHCFNTGSSRNFGVQNCIANMSQDGTIAIFTSDFMGTRGSWSGDYSGTNKSVALGLQIYPKANNSGKYSYVASAAGTTGTSEPNFDSSCAPTCSDGTVTWLRLDATDTTPGCSRLRGDFSWTKSTTVQAGDQLYNGTGGTIYQATVGGTTGTTLPAFSTTCPNYGQSCTDGTVTWTNIGNNDCRGDEALSDLTSPS